MDDLRLRGFAGAVCLTALGVWVSADARAGDDDDDDEGMTIVVSTTEDVVDAADGLISLREAIGIANAHPGSTIVLSGSHVPTAANGVYPEITAEDTTIRGVGHAEIIGDEVSPSPCFDDAKPVHGPWGLRVGASGFTLEGVEVRGFLVDVLVFAETTSLSGIDIQHNTFGGPAMDAVRVLAGNDHTVKAEVSHNAMRGTEDRPLTEGVSFTTDWGATGATVIGEAEGNDIFDLSGLLFCNGSSKLDPSALVVGNMGTGNFDSSASLSASGNTIVNSGGFGANAVSVVGQGFDCAFGSGGTAYASLSGNHIENYLTVVAAFGSLVANEGTAEVYIEENVGSWLQGNAIVLIAGVGDDPELPPPPCDIDPGFDPECLFGKGCSGTVKVESEDNLFQAAPTIPPFTRTAFVTGGMPFSNSAALSMEGDVFVSYPAGAFLLESFFPVPGTPLNAVLYEEEDVQGPDGVTVIEFNPGAVTVNIEGDED
jgi:hypothetical protein